ncbi:hypothetical protein D3C87_1514150 [compost metagenome]
MQVGQEGGTTRLEEAVSLIRRQFCRLLGVCQGITALQQCRILGQASLGFADRVEHHAVEMRERALGGRLGFADARSGAVGRHGPGQRRPEAPAIGRRLAKVVEDTHGADGRADADVRVQLPRGDANRGGCRRQSTLGLPYVGTTLEQRCAIAHRHQLRDLRQFGAGRRA